MQTSSDVVSHEAGERASSAARSLAHCLLLIGTQVLWLIVIGRNWVCTCESVRIWQGALDPAQNSQQITDPYTFLHFAFGCCLYLGLTAFRPEFPITRRAAYAVMSSVLWEICENMPFVIGIFGTAGSRLAYSGDSIVNSLFDTIAAILGFVVASRLSTAPTLALVVMMEGLTFILIRDSVIVGLLRIVVPSGVI